MRYLVRTRRSGGVVLPSGSGLTAQPNITALPVATGQAPDTAAYAALNVPAMAAGGSYFDPVTGVRVWKATSATVPVSNTGMNGDYSEGGHEISCAWGAGLRFHTLLMRAAGGAFWLVDFERGVGFSNYRELTGSLAPMSDLHFTFSSNPATARIAYVARGDNTIQRIDTATMTLANTGFFPFSSATIGEGWWLHQDRNDEWFVGMPAASFPTLDPGRFFLVNAVTGEVRNVAYPQGTGPQYGTNPESNLNEPRIDRDGVWVAAIPGDGNRYYQISGGTFSDFIPRNGAHLGGTPFGFQRGHEAALRGRFVIPDPDTSPGGGADFADGRFRRDVPSLAGGTSTSFTGKHGAGNDNVYAGGNWIQDIAALPGADPNKQWAMIQGVSRVSSPYLTGGAVREGVGYLRADNSEVRLLCHHYNRSPDSEWNTATGYGRLAFPKASPDGRLARFGSRMGLTADGSRVDMFVVEVP